MFNESKAVLTSFSSKFLFFTKQNLTFDKPRNKFLKKSFIIDFSIVNQTTFGAIFELFSMDWIIFDSQIDRLDKLRLYYVEIPYAVLEQTKLDSDKTIYAQRFLIQLNDSEIWQAGAVSLGNQRGYISVKSALLKKLNLALGSKVRVQLQRDLSEFGMEVSPELAEVLHSDPEAHMRFQQLPAGKQRYIIYYVNQVKSSDKRIERSLLLLGNLKKSMPGKESFRELLGK